MWRVRWGDIDRRCNACLWRRLKKWGRKTLPPLKAGISIVDTSLVAHPMTRVSALSTPLCKKSCAHQDLCVILAVQSQDCTASKPGFMVCKFDPTPWHWRNTPRVRALLGSRVKFLSRRTKMQVTPFNFDQYQVRTVCHDDGEVWFVASDVCAALALDNTTRAIERLDDDEQALITIQGISRGNDAVNIINESGLYSLTLTSRKPEAKRFKKWVTSEVLPSVRKTGAYGMAQPQQAIEATPDLVGACNALVASVDAKVLSKKEGANLIRAITLASFHGAGALLAASKPKPTKVLQAPTQATLANGEAVPYELRAKGTKSATDLLHIHGVKMLTREFYDIMEKQNMVTTRYTPEVDESGHRVLIGEGLQYGQNVMLFESPRSNPYFYPDKFSALLKRVGLPKPVPAKPVAAETGEDPKPKRRARAKIAA